MFDIGWSEMAVVALIALLVIGPKELPTTMRAIAKWFRKARGIAREFQSGVDEVIREADLEEARKAVDMTRNFNVKKAVGDAIDPTGDVAQEVRSIEDIAKSTEAEVSTAGSVDVDAFGDLDDADQSEELEEIQATIISSPANIAPPHSLTPPVDDERSTAEPSSPDSPSKERA